MGIRRPRRSNFGVGCEWIDVFLSPIVADTVERLRKKERVALGGYA